MRVLRPIIPLSHPDLQWCFWHCCHSYCSGHQSFLLEHLGVGRAAPYHHEYVLTTFLQLSICILDGKTLGWGAIFSLQHLGHDIDTFPCIGLFCFYGDNSGGKSFYSLCISHEDHFIIDIWIGTSQRFGLPTPWLQLYAQIIDVPPWHLPKASISLSFMTFTTWLIVGVPKIMGTHSANFN